jgi:sec-independent protein translocase protein TatA
MPSIGPLEIIIVLSIALLIFGPKRLPELGRTMGKGMKEFRNSVTGKSDDHAELEQSPKRSASEQAAG